MPGVAIGLSTSALGGDVMFVEATDMPGTGDVVVTGNLGDVIKESAKLAMAWVRRWVQAAVSVHC